MRGGGKVEERTELVRLESYMRNQDCDKKTSTSHNRYNVLTRSCFTQRAEENLGNNEQHAIAADWEWQWQQSLTCDLENWHHSPVCNKRIPNSQSPISFQLELAAAKPLLRNRRKHALETLHQVFMDLRGAIGPHAKKNCGLLSHLHLPYMQ